MLHLHLTTCFNLLDAICGQTDRDAMLRAQCRWGRRRGGVTQHVLSSARMYLYTPCFSPRKLPVVSNILFMLTPQRDGNSTRATDSTTNWLPDWLIDWFDCFLSLSGGGFWGQWGWRIAKMFYWIRSDWLRCKKISTAFSSAPSPESMSSLSAHASVLDGCKQHLKCISIWTYCDCRPTYSAPSQCIFFIMRTNSDICEGISWHFSSALSLTWYIYIFENILQLLYVWDEKTASCQVKVSYFLYQHKQLCIKSFKARAYTAFNCGILVCFSVLKSPGNPKVQILLFTHC